MIKSYLTFIKESSYTDKIKDDLATVIDIEQRQKDIADIKSNMDSTNLNIQKKKDELAQQVDKLQKLQIDDFTEDNKKLLKDKITKYQEDIKSLEELIKGFNDQLDKLKSK
jgi:peptidoglycan hydrolase CwlO-like protein